MGVLKARDKIKDIKVFDRAANAGAYMRTAFVKSKDAAESAGRQAKETQDAGYSSPSDYATGRMTGGAKSAAKKTAEIVGKNPVKQASRNIETAKRDFREAGRQLGKARDAIKKPGAGTIQNTAVKSPAQGAAKELAVKRAQQTARRTRQVTEKTVKAAEKSGRGIKQAARGADRTVKTLSKAVKGTAKTAHKGIKTAETTAKVTVKTTQAAGRAAQAAAKAAKLAVQVSRVAAKAAVTAAKAAVKATAAMVKAAILALKGLVAIIAAGGWVAVAVILVICLIGLLIGSIFGIFFSGEDSGTGKTMPAVVSELTTGFYEEVENIQRSNPHDVLIMDAMAINWRDVLAVYAAKVTTDPENGMEVATLDDTKIGLLRGVLNDMVSLSYNVHTETVTPDDGDDETEDEEVEIVILTISMAQKTASEMAAGYGFSQKQQDQLAELLSPAYADLWAALIGSGFMAGTGEAGEILVGNTGHIPLGIFSWPLAGGYPVNSPFGWRPDPFDPTKTVYHGGMDVACPEGTPILAAASGTVVIANSTDSWGGSYGYYVKIQHDGTFSTLYAHCSSIAVTNGQQVQKGQVIAYVGSTGNSSGNHLHFEVIAGGARVDPQGYFG